MKADNGTMEMMRLLLAIGLLALAHPAAAQEAEPPTPASVVAAAPASDWRPIDPADLLVMDLAPDAAGKPRRVIVQLMPPPFSQGWVENIRTLAKAHWWDGTSVYRVVDNWVAQWGDADETKALPQGVSEQADGAYGAKSIAGEDDTIVLWHPRNYLDDAYSDWAWFEDGWPVAYRIEDETRTLSS